jgi:hypothetical protein
MEEGSRETDGGSEVELMGKGVNITEPRQTYIQSNVEPQTNPVVVVVWRVGEAIGQKG